MATTSNSSSSAPITTKLCASCDRCRARKTKCDGLRPCTNCKNRYIRVNKLSAEEASKIDQIPVEEFDCCYSPAKRRGPTPGKSGGFRNNANNRQQQSLQLPAGGGGQPNNNYDAMGFNGQNDVFLNQGFDTNLTVSNNNNMSGFAMNQPQMMQSNGGNINNNNIMSNNTNNGMGVNNNDNGVDLNALFSQLNSQQQQQQQQVNNNNNGGTDQMKELLLLQQQLMIQQQQIQQQQIVQQLASSAGLNAGGGIVNNNNLGMGGVNNGGGGGALQLLQQYQNSQQEQMPSMGLPQQQQQMQGSNQMNPISVVSGQQQSGGNAFADLTTSNNNYHQPPQDEMTRSAKRTANAPPSTNNNNIPTAVSKHLPLLHPNNPSGSLLRQYFELSTNNVLNLPPIPTDEEYSKVLQQQQNGSSYDNNSNNGTLASNLPSFDQSALNAARFSQLALGALSNDQLELALELSNACVLSLKNCVDETNRKSCLPYLARAYLLHGIFRSLRADFVRYFKYRRVCMTQIALLNEYNSTHDDENVDALLAAISFHDAWAYMMYNAVEDALPDIDHVVPRVCNDGANNSGGGGGGCHQELLTDPINQMWMQGEPRIFLKNEARIVDRSLDAISCAVRSCCDQANREFEQMSQAMGGGGSGGEGGMCSTTTPTSLAVMANENELCSRNMVLSAQALLDQTNANQPVRKPGLKMMVTAMDAFLENSDQDDSSGGGGGGGGGDGGFSETQIRNLLAACEMLIKHPMLLHAPGPVYHMMSNAAILLCHLLNGLHAKCSVIDPTANSEKNGKVKESGEIALFYNTLDAFMSIRKLLNTHRNNLPVRLRCHAIPRPNIGPLMKTDPGSPFIDLGETLMCSCRGCQGFVLMGCSPCVAAERSMRSAKALEVNLEEDGDFQRDIDDMGDFDLDDDALFTILSRIASN